MKKGPQARNRVRAGQETNVTRKTWQAPGKPLRIAKLLLN
jgi:hypothetical protein